MKHASLLWYCFCTSHSPPAPKRENNKCREGESLRGLVWPTDDIYCCTWRQPCELNISCSFYFLSFVVIWKLIGGVDIRRRFVGCKSDAVVMLPEFRIRKHFFLFCCKISKNWIGRKMTQCSASSTFKTDSLSWPFNMTDWHWQYSFCAFWL